MTVIAGVKLTDHICLIADSRVSYVNEETDETIVKHDDMLKIESLQKLDGCVIASAGDARFAQFIIKALNRDFQNKDIVYLRENIDKWMREQAHIYFQRYISVANFIVAGIDNSSNEMISKEQYLKIKNAYANTKSPGGGIDTKYSHLFSDLSRDESHVELPTKRSILFSVKVSGRGVDIEDAEWGEVLISGPQGVSREDISDASVGRLEFENSSDDGLQGNYLLLVAIVNSLIEKKKLPSVGGALVPIFLMHNKYLATFGRRIHSSDLNGQDVRFVTAYEIDAGRFYRLDEKGTKYRMREVSKFNFDAEGGDLSTMALI